MVNSWPSDAMSAEARERVLNIIEILNGLVDPDGTRTFAVLSAAVGMIASSSPSPKRYIKSVADMAKLAVAMSDRANGDGRRTSR